MKYNPADAAKVQTIALLCRLKKPDMASDPFLYFTVWIFKYTFVDPSLSLNYQILGSGRLSWRLLSRLWSKPKAHVVEGGLGTRGEQESRKEGGEAKDEIWLQASETQVQIMGAGEILNGRIFFSP